MVACKTLDIREKIKTIFSTLLEKSPDGKQAQLMSGDRIDEMVDNMMSIFQAKYNKKKLFNSSDEELTAEVLKEVEIARQHELLVITKDAIKQEDVFQLISQAEDPLGALEALMVGKVKTFTKTGDLGSQEGSRLSIDTIQETQAEQAIGSIQNDLSEEKVLDVFTNIEMEETILDVGYKVLQDPNYKPVNAKEIAALKVAKVLIRQWEARSLESTKSGAYKSEAKDAYEEIFGLQGHDHATLYKADKDEWAKFMKENADLENTVLVDADGVARHIETPEQLDEYLDGLWDSITSGRNMIYDGDSYALGNSGTNVFLRSMQNIVRKSFSGRGNIGAKESTPSQIKFKNGKSAKAYKDKYIKRSLVESVYNQTNSQTRNNVLMAELGTNPKNQLKALVTRTKDLVTQRAAKARKKASQKETTKKEKIELEREIIFAKKRLANLKPGKGDTNLPTRFSRWMDELDGSSNQLDAGTYASHIAFYSRALRTIQVMSKLGSATISAISDISFQVGALTNSGMPGMKALGRTLGNIFDGLGSTPAERKKYANSMGVGIQAFKGSLLSKVGAGQDMGVGLLSRMQQQFFKFNLMSWWNDSHAIGMSFTFSNHVASHKKLSFNKLSGEFKKTLLDYRIGEKEWDILREHAVVRLETGEEIISVKDLNFEGKAKKDIQDIVKNKTPTGFDDVETTIKGNWQRTVRNPAEYLDTIKKRYVTMVNDTSRNGIMIPGAWEKAATKVGTQAGSFTGEIVRQAMLFKTFPITVYRKAMLNKLYSKSHTGKNNYAGTAMLFLGSSILGATAIQLKEITKGRSPRDMDPTQNPEFWLQAALQGGAGGIYADLIIGTGVYPGQSIGDQLLGPGINTTFQAVGVLQQAGAFAFGSEDTTAIKDLSKLVKNNIPYQNLFYARAVQDMLLYNFILEQLNPGYLRREEQRIMSNDGQKYFAPRSLIE